MKAQTTSYSPEEPKVMATSTLREALRALKIPDQAVMILSGFRAIVPKQDLLGSEWVS